MKLESKTEVTLSCAD